MSSRRGNGGGSGRDYYSSTGGGGSSDRNSYRSGGSGYGGQYPPRSSSHSGSPYTTITSGNRNTNQHNAPGSSSQAYPVYNPALDPPRTRYPVAEPVNGVTNPVGPPPSLWPTAEPVNGVFPPVPPPPVDGLRFDNSGLPPPPVPLDESGYDQIDALRRRDHPSSQHSQQSPEVQEQDRILYNSRYQRHLRDQQLERQRVELLEREKLLRERAGKRPRRERSDKGHPRDHKRRRGPGGPTGTA